MVAGCAGGRNPAAIDAVHQPAGRGAVRSLRGAPPSAEVRLRRGHVGSRKEPSWLSDPRRGDPPRRVEGRSVLKTAALSSVWQGETSKLRRLVFTPPESSEGIKQRVNFPVK